MSAEDQGRNRRNLSRSKINVASPRCRVIGVEIDAPPRYSAALVFLIYIYRFKHNNSEEEIRTLL